MRATLPGLWMLVAMACCAVAMTAQGAGSGDAASTSETPVVAFINQEVRAVWEDNEVEPSRVADDFEWLRRVSLDIVGRIPATTEIDAYVRDRAPSKQAALIERLLSDPGYVPHWTQIWTNLLLGRTPQERTSRDGLARFLSEAFQENRPWNDVVHDLLTAEGHFEEQGQVNFLLGQLDGNPGRADYTVEATARATRLFLGMQLQCTQCHNHPFNDWKQAQFWEIDSFFKQMQRIDHRRTDPETGRQVDDYSELAWRNFSGPVYFEKRTGVMEVAYPRYAGRDVGADGHIERRQELARLLASEDVERLVARAMVNRMWGHFFGFGLVNPVDDMGPHNPPSHPAILDRLTEEFAASGYDLKSLMRWIAGSDAYRLTSRFHEGNRNRVDDPTLGEPPLFSRMYVKSLTPEQVYRSLHVAAGSSRSEEKSDRMSPAARAPSLQDFVDAFGEQDDEGSSRFRGSITQSLLMMNGDLVQRASGRQSGEDGMLQTVLGNDQFRTDVQRINRLFQASLGRNPSRREATAAQRLISGSSEKWSAYEDLYWALLNSNEFILNH
ncbi:MAG: DUF1549 domain-containing protein [Planctomycetaceae bacterium]|nr:DUF1549 domain-containing protein [Planctomycetaceae bacterium]